MLGLGFEVISIGSTYTKMLKGGDPADEANWLECIAIIAGPKGADSDANLITDPDNGKLFTRLGWYNTHDKSDALGMIAGTRFIRDIRGPGIHFGGR